MNATASTKITDAHSPTSASTARRVLSAIVVAVGLNFVTFWLATTAIGPLSITPPGAVEPITITAFTLIVATIIPMGSVGTIVWLTARRWPAIRALAAWAGLSFSVLSAALLFTMGADLRTTAILAAIHAIAGIVWFGCLMARNSRALSGTTSPL